MIFLKYSGSSTQNFVPWKWIVFHHTLIELCQNYGAQMLSIKQKALKFDLKNDTIWRLHQFKSIYPKYKSMTCMLMNNCLENFFERIIKFVDIFIFQVSYLYWCGSFTRLIRNILPSSLKTVKFVIFHICRQPWEMLHSK